MANEPEAHGWRPVGSRIQKIDGSHGRRLAGLEGPEVGNLEGWGFIKKVGKWVKKRVTPPGGWKKFQPGKALMKLTKTAVIAAAIPVVGAGFGPLAALSSTALKSKFGSKIANLVKNGRTKIQKVQTTAGKVSAALLTPAEQAAVSASIKTAGGIISQAALDKILNATGIQSEEILIDGSITPDNKLEVPYNGAEEVKVENVKASDWKPFAFAAAGIAAVALIFKGGRRGR